MIRLCFFALSITLLLSSCGGKKSGSKPTAGRLRIAADEALKPIVEAEIDAFMALNTKAQIDVFYVSEEQAIDTLLKDSVQLIFITRRLVEDEHAILKANTRKGRETMMAKGGIALIVHPDNPDTLLTIDNLKDILSGKISNWNQLSKRASLPLNVVFDQPNSGMIKYLGDSLLPLPKLPPNCFAVDSNSAVVDYVTKHPEALGLIDVSWISDEDDATTNVFRHSIKVVGMAKTAYEDFSKPYQAYISLGKYPLKRDLYMITTETHTGLATGFSRFVASDTGQRIILKSGLVPATMPVRIVETKRRGI
jgi:phosphate transport system substrate-binding protein